MKIKIVVFFVLAFAVSALAANYHWGDSAHAIGLIKKSGGEARHAVHLESGKNRYMLIATATVIPPYRGDMRVILEGEPFINHWIYLSEPVVNLGLRRLPVFRNNILYHLEPHDSIALWIDMKPPKIDPVCGMADQEGFKTISYNGWKYVFCSDGCLEAFQSKPEKYKGLDYLKGRYNLAFYDTRTNRRVLNVPIIFNGKGDVGDGGHLH